MKTHLALLLALASALPAATAANSAESWTRRTEDDKLHGKIHEYLRLEGKYVQSPRSGTVAPVLIVSCAAGKIEDAHLWVDAIIDSNSSALFPVHVEARIDGKKTLVLGDGVSTDGQSVFLDKVGLKKILGAREVLLGVREYVGGEVVVQFDMPDPAPVYDACPKDKIVKRKM